ncbi:MAG: hypothetical protein J5858_16030 [Lentisphaeria bacterium]|nr:hypothetical protein [Lentisphaeria bacterium]
MIWNTKNGNNSYIGSSYNMVNIGFFQQAFINIAVKVLLILLYLLTLYKIWLRGRKESGEAKWHDVFPSRLTALEWASFTVLTLVISYHRAYDCFLFLPFIGVLFIDLFRKISAQGKFKSMDCIVSLFLVFLLLFWAVPPSIVFRFEAFLGNLFPAGEKVFVYSSYEFMHYDKTMFPLTKIIMLFTAFFLFAMELSPFANRFSDPQTNRDPENDKTK